MRRLAAVRLAAVALLSTPAVAFADGAYGDDDPDDAPADPYGEVADPDAAVAIDGAPGQQTETPADPDRGFSAPGAVEPIPPPVPPPAGGDASAESPIDGFRAHDASAGRAYAMGSALTERAGTVTFHLNQPTLPGGKISVAAALTDRIELGAGLIYGDDDAIRTFNIKVQAWKSRTAAIAIQGGALGVDGKDDHLGYLGVIGSACLDPACHTLVSAHATALFVPQDDYGGGYNSETVLPIVGGASLVAGGSGSGLKLVLEAETAEIDRDEHALAAYAGLRAAGPKLSGDVGIIAGFGDGEAALAPALFFGASARF